MEQLNLEQHNLTITRCIKQSKLFTDMFDYYIYSSHNIMYIIQEQYNGVY